LNLLYIECVDYVNCVIISLLRIVSAEVISLRARLRMINTSLLQLAGAFLLGVILGTLAGYLSSPVFGYTNPQVGCSLVALFWLPLSAFLLGTSLLGCWLVPLLMLLRGYMLSASFLFLLHGGYDLKTACVLTALPALFSVPALFLLSEEALSSSRILQLCSESGLTRRCVYIRPVRLLVTVLLLLIAAAVQIHFIPQIV